MGINYCMHAFSPLSPVANEQVFAILFFRGGADICSLLLDGVDGDTEVYLSEGKSQMGDIL